MAYSMEYTYMRDPYPLASVESVIARIIDLFIAIIEALLGLRLVLHFLGAGSGNAFMAWLDGVTGQMVAPFAGIFPTWNFGGFSVELSTVFAMIAYAVIGWIIVRLVYFLFSLMRPAL